MALDPALLVRAASGTLYVLAGLFILIVRTRPARNVFLALMLIGMGLGFAILNLMIGARAPTPGIWVVVAANVVEIVAGGAMVCFLARQGEVRLAPLLATILASGALAVTALIIELANPNAVLVAVVGVTPWPPEALDAVVAEDVLSFFVYAIYGTALVAALLGLRRSAAPQARGAVLMMVPFVGHGAIKFGSSIVVVQNAQNLAYAVAAATCLVAALLAPAFAGASSRRFGAAVAATGAAAAGLGLAAGTMLVRAGTDYGLTGMGRTLVVLPLLWAIFRCDLLGAPLRTAARRVGVVASVGLAVLVLGAQAVQPYVPQDKSYLGVVAGVAAAGISLVAQPVLQRRLARRNEELPDGPLDRYRRHVELAWTDGRVSANEKLMLAESRRQLGIGAEDAHRVEEEVAAGHAAKGRKRRRRVGA